MGMGYWSMAILFWQLSIDHIVNVLYKRCGLAKTRQRHPSLPFDSLPYPTRTIRRRVRTLGQSRDNQKKRGWPYSMSMGLCPTRTSRAREPRYYYVLPCITMYCRVYPCIAIYYYVLPCIDMYRHIFNNYSPKAKLILLNNPRDEVEGIIQQC